MWGCRGKTFVPADRTSGMVGTTQGVIIDTSGCWCRCDGRVARREREYGSWSVWKVIGRRGWAWRHLLDVKKRSAEMTIIRKHVLDVTNRFGDMRSNVQDDCVVAPIIRSLDECSIVSSGHLSKKNIVKHGIMRTKNNTFKGVTSASAVARSMNVNSRQCRNVVANDRRRKNDGGRTWTWSGIVISF
jgi:hypothetical protein